MFRQSSSSNAQFTRVAVRVALICALAATTSARAQNSAAAPHLRQFTSVAIAPDGQHLAWIGPDSRRGETVAVELAANGGRDAPEAVALPSADRGSMSELAWSPDSRQLLVRATTGNGTPALYIVGATGGSARRVATVTGSVHDARFSPDASRIAVLYSSPSEEANGPTQATPRDTGAMDTHIDRQHLAIVDVATGELKVISKPTSTCTSSTGRRTGKNSS